VVSLPLPILTFVLSAVACTLLWRLDLGRRAARGFFIGVFVLIACGALLVGLRFGYGIDQLIVLQRTIPLFIGPFVYLGYAALFLDQQALRRAMIKHLGVAAGAAAIPQMVLEIRPVFDLFIGASYLFYCIVLVLLWRRGPDGLNYAALEMVHSLRQWLLGAAGLLGVMLVFDGGIAVSFAQHQHDNAVQLISYGSSISIVIMILAIIAFSRRPVGPGTAKPTPAAPETDTINLERDARSLLEQSRLYLETDLTLERLAKRLHVPARALSEAINQTQQINVSQYVNGFRLSHAAHLLETGDLKVTQVMEQSGFLTRSNFYREFERVYAVSPSKYRISCQTK